MDATIVFVIDACIMNLLIFSVTMPLEDVDSNALIDSTDVRFSVMDIISFISYFNQMVISFFLPDSAKNLILSLFKSEMCNDVFVKM